MDSILINSLYQNRKCLLFSSLLLLIVASPLQSTLFLSAHADPDEKSESTTDTKKLSADEKKADTVEKKAGADTDIDNSKIQENSVPVAKMVYNNKSYEMSPFVVVENEDLKRLNFPQLADDFQPIAQISPDDNISFSFLTKPREMNAFFVDYDADTTEMTPLHRVGKNQFSFTDVYGPNTLELRVIYPDGKYVTYTCLIEVMKPEVKEVSLDANLVSDNNDMMNSNDNSYPTTQSYNPDSSEFGQTSPAEEHVVNQYNEMFDMDNEQNTSLDSLNFDQESTNTCEYNEIPIVDVQTDTNNNNSNSDMNSTNSDAKPRWATLDLGQEQNICGLKVSFANVDNEIKFFTLEFSNDGKKYTTAEYYSSTGTNSASEIYDLKEGPIKARFIKITELDITESIQWISDLIVLGKAAL
ncbi:MAG: discoidin domain-containing protein [Nitrososphaeraceae archaeon]|nr:discoidin domain-containing protein [Nitrososphaeraceae archaeon]MDW0277189.1 discoidin domain-containing protein [Nitrososphaeraceae archaeon]MDW0341492.1 discoidin domain-containing protein [Nitrososphaeraceae archaeon]